MSEPVLSREEFRELVLSRSKGKCIFCGARAIDAHHIFDRKLYPETGGFFLSNGAAVCDAHHWDCEITKITVEEVQVAAGIARLIFPDCLNPMLKYDKWGNEIRADGTIAPGPLFNDSGVKKALSKGRMLGKIYYGE